MVRTDGEIFLYKDKTVKTNLLLIVVMAFAGTVFTTPSSAAQRILSGLVRV
jgi:hypothetical protein